MHSLKSWAVGNPEAIHMREKSLTHRTVRAVAPCPQT